MNRIHWIGLIATVWLMSSCTGGGTPVETGEEKERTFAKGQSTVADDESTKNILQVALGSDAHSTLVAAVQAAELEDVLVNAGPLTVFAPTNDAFAALPDGVVDDLLKPENKGKLARIIKYHAAPGAYKGDLFRDGQRLFQASGHYVEIGKSGDEVTIEGVKILGTVDASNGIVHVIDKVLLPPD